MTCRKVALAAFMLLVWPTMASAQQVMCTAAPKPPERVQSKVDSPIAATVKAPYTPAVLNLSWEGPNWDRDHPIDVPTFYVIEAGSDRGRSDIARVNTLALSFTTPMAKGVYYIRVRSANACGMSQASQEVMVRIDDSVAQGEPNPLVLLSTVASTPDRLGDKAYVRVMGEVRNGWAAAPAPFVKVTVSFEGQRGDDLGITGAAYVNGTARRLKRSHIVTDTVLEPGATGCFVMFAEFPKPEVFSAGVWAAAAYFDTEPLEGKVEIDGAIGAKSDGFHDLVVSGHIRNAGDRPTRFNEIWVEGSGGAGQVLDCHATSVQASTSTSDDGLTTRAGLQSAQRAVFESTGEAMFSWVKGLRAWVTWDESDDHVTPVLTERYRRLKKQLVTLLEGDEQGTSPWDVANARDALREESRLIEERLTTISRK